VFSTAADNQPSVDIHVLQGERPMASDNRTLGRFVLDGIVPAPRGVPQIEVTFDIDANGILNVKACDKGTGKEQKITITSSSGLSKEEVERMQKDAEAHEAEDKNRKDLAEAKNIGDNMAYNAEKTLNENKDKVPEDLKKDVENKVAALRKTLESDDLEAIKRDTQALNETMQKIGTQIYQQSNTDASQGPTGDAGSSSNDDGTVEGEFREV